MPSPNTSPNPTESPSGIRGRELLSPPSNATGPWMVSQVEAATETGEGVDRPQVPRRSLMNVMRSSVPEGRRRSRPATGEVNEEMFSTFVMQLAGNGASGFEAIANNINSRRQNSPLRNKIVYLLRCQFCMQKVCVRAMKAILLADTKIELYSTDIPPNKLIMLEDDRMTQGCHCRIRDTVCGCCGNILGYHVSQPCDRCLDAKNNGHFWMFYSETVMAWERPDPATGKALSWGALSPMRELDESFSEFRRYELFCR
jgi:hypothetical protein